MEMGNNFVDAVSHAYQIRESLARRFVAISPRHIVQVEEEERLTLLLVPLVPGGPGRGPRRNYRRVQIPSEECATTSKGRPSKALVAE